jgi:signal transduction histidine kinase
MKRGAFDFLPKPFTPDELRMITDRGLERRRLVLEGIALRREREMLRENFAAIVSHELKSPLSAVQQNLFVLSAELAPRLEEAQQNRLERIQARIADMLKMIQTWLRAVSVPVENLRESFVPVALEPVIAKAAETVQPEATRKDIQVAVVAAGPLPLVQGDEGSLTEAVVNLVGNAIKYTPAGGKVEVRAARAPEGVVLTVTDNGVGIAPDDLPFVFDGFYRGKTAGAETGVGLGLALTRRIVEAHGGSISVESQLGRGTTFVMRLPLPGPDPTNPPRGGGASSTREPGDTP